MWVLLLFVMFYGLKRNEMTHDFRIELINMSMKYELIKISKRDLSHEPALDWFVDKHSYTEMLLKFYKPLKLKYWYTEEELYEINNP